MDRRTFLLAAPATIASATVADASLPPMVTPGFTPSVGGQGIIASCSIIRITAGKSLPTGASLQGAQFRCIDGEIDADSIWVSAMTQDYRLIHMRPNVYEGWR